MIIMSSNQRKYDSLIEEIAKYTLNYKPKKVAIEAAADCFTDSFACMIMALQNKDCKRHLGALFPELEYANGCVIPGTNYRLDPIQAAFNITTMIRWLDYNDTWLAQEWGHPSDNIGGIIAVLDWCGKHNKSTNYKLINVWEAMVIAYEIQGVMALNNCFNAIGIDHVILVKLATTALATKLLGGGYQQICRAVSQVFVDGNSLRTYRHFPNVGPRKSWAAGDAVSRGLRIAFLCIQDEPGYPTALTADKWGFEDVYCSGKPLELAQPFADYVIKNILFKVSYPAEFHGQTAVEAAIKLHNQVKNRLQDISRIEIKTQLPAMQIINKTGDLQNPADRDHCLQYMVAIGLLYGELSYQHYLDAFAINPQIDKLRKLMIVTEDSAFSSDYYDLNKRAITNAIQVHFSDGTCTPYIEIAYPIGHPRRRNEAVPLLQEKLENSMHGCFSKNQAESLLSILSNRALLADLSITAFLEYGHIATKNVTDK